MAETYEPYYNYWSIAQFVLVSFIVVALLATLAIIPLIMLQAFFGDNKFNVKGKVRLPNSYRRAILIVADCPYNGGIGGNGEECCEAASKERRKHCYRISVSREAGSSTRRG